MDKKLYYRSYVYEEGKGEAQFWAENEEEAESESEHWIEGFLQGKPEIRETFEWTSSPYTLEEERLK